MDTSNTLVIGASGLIGSGKDAFLEMVGEALKLEGIRVIRRAFGDPLKEEVAAMLARQLKDHPDFVGLTASKRRAKLLAMMMGPKRPEKEQFRILMQWWGTEFRRGMFGADYWTNLMDRYVTMVAASYPDDQVVILIPDVRFVDEADFCTERGQVVKIIRQLDTPTEGLHASERAMNGYNGFTKVIHNRKSLHDLNEEAKQYAAELVMTGWPQS